MGRIFLNHYACTKLRKELASACNIPVQNIWVGGDDPDFTTSFEYIPVKISTSSVFLKKFVREIQSTGYEPYVEYGSMRHPANKKDKQYQLLCPIEALLSYLQGNYSYDH